MKGDLEEIACCAGVRVGVYASELIEELLHVGAGIGAANAPGMFQEMTLTRLHLVLPALLLLVLLAADCGYNALADADEEVKTAWGQVELVYQRRADLVPDLIAAVKADAAHEQAPLAAVAQARARASQVKLTAADLSRPSKFLSFELAQGQLSQSLRRLLAAAERSPELQASAKFRDLQAHLEVTEDRIAAERRRYNEVVERYNALLRSFPRHIVAHLFGFTLKESFHVNSVSADRATKIRFEALTADLGPSRAAATLGPGGASSAY